MDVQTAHIVIAVSKDKGKFFLSIDKTGLFKILNCFLRGGESMEKIVRCEKCGAMVKVLIDCTCENCGIKCCNETMKEISEEEAKKYLERK